MADLLVVVTFNDEPVDGQGGRGEGHTHAAVGCPSTNHIV
jgi:hypothetical protein